MQQPTLPSQLETFKSHASEFHRLLDAIRVDLRREILLQDEAEILVPLQTGAAAGSSGASTGPAGPNAGGFDIGLLNVRSDAVEKDMEQELWEKARSFVVNMESVREAKEVEKQLLEGTKLNTDGDVEMVTRLPAGDGTLTH